VRTKFFAVLALTCLSTGALAADLESAPVTKAYAPAVAAVYNWTGFYLGAEVGGGWSRFSAVDPTMPAAGSTTANASGVLAGGLAGFNYQIGNVVLGAEGSYDWSGISISQNGAFGGGGGFSATVKNDYVATAAARVGYAFDRVLFYGKGGAAWTRDKVDASDGLGGTGTGRFNRVGWLAGAGVEYAFLQNWSVKLEYDYMRFGQLNETPTTTGGLAASSALVKLDMQKLLFGVNYRF
jgi:outer membrane immunogenic protein